MSFDHRQPIQEIPITYCYLLSAKRIPVRYICRCMTNIVLERSEIGYDINSGILIRDNYKRQACRVVYADVHGRTITGTYYAELVGKCRAALKEKRRGKL